MKLPIPSPDETTPIGGTVGDEVKHADDARRPEQPPGVIVRVDDTGRVTVQPFDAARAEWTAGPADIVPDDGVWFPTDSAQPDNLLPFPIPPGTITPLRYGGLRPKPRPDR
ncbi:hypothetical protein B4N89_14025 [Embleya scabrispora]|uniref:Uncharacterized protein n=1 Tax=Embleya scabrispora TaxID=159449 RepID=A0A1T3NYU2_9ACTN|nr:hypothetical protein [Embleya scabrispora]OPC81905.1 hypothetical protein B4N89_14025 [Embleya scabrispora]